MAESFAAHVITLDLGDSISQIDYNSHKDIVDAIEKLLLQGEYVETQTSFQETLVSCISKFCSVNLEVAGIATQDDIAKYLDLPINDPEAFGTWLFTLGSSVDLLFSCYDVYTLSRQEALVMEAIAINYSENLATIQELKNNTDDPAMYRIYEIVEERMQGTYAETLENLFDPNHKEDEIVEEMTNFVVGTVAAIATMAAPEIGLVIGAVKICNTVFSIEEYYEAADGIYTAYNSIELFVPELEKAMSYYKESPSEYREYLINNALILAYLKENALSLCVEYTTIEQNNVERFGILMLISGQGVYKIIELIKNYSKFGGDPLDDFNSDLAEIREYQAFLEGYSTAK